MPDASVRTDVDPSEGLARIGVASASSGVGAVPWLGLIWTLVRTDFKVRYHGTLGGFAWALAKPLAMFALLMGVFSFVFGSDPDYRLNLIIGRFPGTSLPRARRPG